MANEEWHVGAVLKNKLNSQGTLFRGGTKYSSPERFPRGYTPERRNAVAEAVVRPSITVDTRLQRTQSDDRVFHTGTQSSHFKDRRVNYGVVDGKPHLANESAKPTRDLVDNIARSTVPLEHLSGVQFRTNAEQGVLGHNVAGHYSRAGDPVIRLGPGYERETTTIHEIGHHVSSVEGNEWKQNYSHASSEGGHEEAYADNYASEHFRNKRGQAEPRGTYGGGPYAGVIQRSPEFWDGYRKNRDHSHVAAQTRAADAEYYKRHPEEEVHPGNTVQDALMEKDHTYDNNGREIAASVGELRQEALPPHDWSKYHV